MVTGGRVQETVRPEEPRMTFREKIFHHLDGVAISSTVWALAHRGVFTRLSGSDRPQEINALASEFGCRRGYLHLAMKLLACQGFLQRNGEIAHGRIVVSLTKAGTEWLKLLPAYDRTPEAIDVAMSLPYWFSGKLEPDYAKFLSLIQTPPLHDSGSTMAARVQHHVEGFLIAAIMKEFALDGTFDLLARREAVDLRDFSGPERLIVPAFELLAAQGWIRRSGSQWALNCERTFILGAALQYFPAICYLATFKNVPELLFGHGSDSLAFGTNGTERHVDRKLDIRFSGEVFMRTYFESFLELTLPLFQCEPVQNQPVCVVDTGSGDGTMLKELYLAVRKSTLRGRRLREHPLLMVGAEYNRIAQETTTETLRGAGIPHRTIFGDIGDPAGLAKRLTDFGINPLDVLHISKSVIHNRTFRPPAKTEEDLQWEACSNAVFVSPDGDLIPARDMECNLVEHFKSWIPWTVRHGMIVMETHTADSEMVARRIGHNVVTGLDAIHGYSNQYPVEISVFRRAAEAAGYISRSGREFGHKMVGQPILSLDHFISGP